MTFSKEERIHYILRLAVAMCFIGHGAFGIIMKPIWYNYFAVMGIGYGKATHLMPLLGCFDILLGMIVLIYPIRIIPFWLVVWGIVTALFRPLSGEPFGEFVERAGNFGAPLAWVIFSGGFKWNVKFYFTPIKPSNHLDPKDLNRGILCLKIIGFFLLAGHGWLNLIEKKGLLNQYEALGFSDPIKIASMVGLLEIVIACSVLIRPIRPLILAFFIWKVGTELFYPKYEILEWIERGGSYGTLLALWVALGAKNEISNDQNKVRTYSPVLSQ
ncbi:MAG TPA: hypothetical protein VFV08_11970 [Puia sp.]|nr:hypothetical protein [Puia sp.]